MFSSQRLLSHLVAASIDANSCACCLNILLYNVPSRLSCLSIEHRSQAVVQNMYFVVVLGPIQIPEQDVMATWHRYTCCPTTLETDFPDLHPTRRSLKADWWKVTCKDQLLRYSMGNSLGDSVMDIVARIDTAVSSRLLVLVDAVTTGGSLITGLPPQHALSSPSCHPLMSLRRVTSVTNVFDCCGWSGNESVFTFVGWPQFQEALRYA